MQVNQTYTPKDNEWGRQIVHKLYRVLQIVCARLKEDMEKGKNKKKEEDSTYGNLVQR